MSRPLKLCNAHSGRCTLACNRHLASPVVFLQSLHCKYTVKLSVIFLNGTLRIETKFCFMSKAFFACIKVFTEQRGCFSISSPFWNLYCLCSQSHMPPHRQRAVHCRRALAHFALSPCTRIGLVHDRLEKPQKVLSTSLPSLRCLLVSTPIH